MLASARKGSQIRSGIVMYRPLPGGAPVDNKTCNQVVGEAINYQQQNENHNANPLVLHACTMACVCMFYRMLASDCARGHLLNATTTLAVIQGIPKTQVFNLGGCSTCMYSAHNTRMPYDQSACMYYDHSTRIV